MHGAAETAGEREFLESLELQSPVLAITQFSSFILFIVKVLGLFKEFATFCSEVKAAPLAHLADTDRHPRGLT